MTDEREKDRQEEIRKRDLMKSLLDNPGWKYLEAVCKLQIDLRRNNIMATPTKDAMEQEFMKGECAGIQAMLRVPQLVFDQAKEVLELYKKENE